LSVTKKPCQDCQAYAAEAEELEIKVCDLIYKRDKRQEAYIILRQRWQARYVALEREVEELHHEADEAEKALCAKEDDNYLLRDRRRAAVRALLGLRKQRQLDQRQHQLDQERINDLEATVAKLEADAGKPRFGL
jgi:hypothetical protein